MPIQNSEIAFVSCHFNPCNYVLPVENLAKTKESLAKFGIGFHVATCEFCSYEDLKAGKAGEDFISASIIWQKEALLNAAVARLPGAIKYVVIIDADVLIDDENWLEKLKESLENHSIVQPWKRGIFLNADGEEQGLMASCGYGDSLDDPRASNFRVYHPGLIWAFRRNFWTIGPGLFDLCPVGTGDVLLANALISSTPNEIDATNQMLSEKMRQWENDLSTWIRDERIGYVDADIKTLYHGEFKNRKYASRVELAKDFDPSTDLKPRTGPGPIEWSDYARENKAAMIQGIAGYFNARLEDGDTWTKEEVAEVHVNPPDQPNLYPEEFTDETPKIPYEL